MPNPIAALSNLVSGTAKLAQGFLSRTAEDPLFPVKSVYWFVFGQGRDPFLPEEGLSIEERAKAARTREEAQALIDDVLLGGLTRTDYLLLDIFRRKNVLQRFFVGRLDPTLPAFQPFSNANAYIAVDAASRIGRSVDPYTPVDKWFDEIFRKSERNMLLYLRETDPLSLMPYLYETDIKKTTGGGHFWSPITDFAGRILSSTWKHISGLFLMPERLEQVLGQIAWNNVPDPYMRYALSRNFYELNYTFLEDFIRGNEPFARGRELMDKLADIRARGLKGEELLQEYEKAIDDTTTLAGWIGNLFNLIVVDPLWLIPGGKIAGAGARGFEKAFGFSPTRIFRLFGTGGDTLGYGIKGLLQLDEATYQYKRLLHPHVGVVRTLFSQQPDRLANEAIRQLRFKLMGFSDDLFRLDDASLRRLQDLERTFAEGKPVGWVADRIPDILDDPSLAFLSASVRGRKWLESALNDEAVQGIVNKVENSVEIAKSSGREALEREAASLGMSVDEYLDWVRARSTEVLLLESVMSKAQVAVRDAQREIFKKTALGRLFLRSDPLIRGVKQWVARFSFGPSFVAPLNLVGNYFRFFWHAARHPMEATSTFTRALGVEIGGRWPASWERMLKNVLVNGNPIDIELSVVRNTGFHELLGTKKATEFLSDIDDPVDFFRTIVRQLDHPAKDILNQSGSKFFGIPTNLIWWPLHAAAGIDRATRRATFIMSLREQLHEVLVPGWIARRVIPNVEDRLAAAGLDPEQSRLVMGRFIDKMRRGLFDGDGFVEGDTAASFITRAMDEALEEAGVGSAAVIFNPTKLLYDWAKARGYTGDAATAATNNMLGHDVVGRVERVLSEVTPDDDLATVLTKIDSIGDDYFTLNSVGAELASQPAYVQRRNILTDSKLTVDSMKQAWMETVSFPYRLIETKMGKEAFYNVPREIRLPDGTTATGKPARIVHEYVRKATVDQFKLLKETEERAASLRKQGVEGVVPGYAGAKVLDEKSFSEEVYNNFLHNLGQRGRRPKSPDLDAALDKILKNRDAYQFQLFTNAIHDAVLESLVRGRPVDASTFRKVIDIERKVVEAAGTRLDKDAVSYLRQALAARQYMAHGIGGLRPHFFKPTSRRGLLRVDARGPRELRRIEATRIFDELAPLGLKRDVLAGSPLVAAYVPTDNPSLAFLEATIQRAAQSGTTNVYIVDAQVALKELPANKISPSDFWQAVEEGYDGVVITGLPDGGEVVLSFYDLVPLNTSSVSKMIPDSVSNKLLARAVRSPRGETVRRRIVGTEARVEKVIYNEITKRGGVSISISGEKFVPGEVDDAHAWAVSVYPARATRPIPKSEFTVDHVKRFIDENLDLLGKHGHYVFGGWESEGQIYLDVSILLPSRIGRLSEKETKKLVLELAARKDQKAIYDMLNARDEGVSITAPLSIDALWKKYFDVQEQTMGDVYELFSSLAGSDKTRRKLLDEWRDTVLGTYKEHRRIISEHLERKGMLPDETLESFLKRKAEERNLLFGKMREKLSQLTGLNHPDKPLAGELLDTSFPLAVEVDDYLRYVSDQIKENWQAFKEGKLAFRPEPGAEVFKDVARGLARDWDDIRRAALGNAMAKTDFVMLNYNNQYGIDYVIQAFAPFAFWPTRDALHWIIRTARAPGAMAGLAQLLAQSEELRKQYNIPERFEYKLPIYLPGASQFLEKLPIVGQLAQTGDMGDWFFIDPVRFVVPYRDFLVQYSNEDRRSTALGRIADFIENATPLAINPFAKLIGSQVGLLDRDAWGNVFFGGGPFGIPLTPAAQAAAAWLYNGDPLAIPAEEQERFTETGSFSSNFLLRILGVEPDKWDIYRAERAVWTLVATGKLLPGKSQEEQVRAGWEAISTHRGEAWKRAVKAANSLDFFRQLTRFTMFPAGDVMAVHEGETLWWGLKQAYTLAAEQGDLDKFFEKYPEFQMRKAVVRGISDEKEKLREVDTELYYQDLERYVNGPFKLQLDLIETELAKLRKMPQTETVRQSIDILEAERRAIREQQEERRKLLDLAYPNRKKELSLNRLPRDRALTRLRNMYFDIDDDDFDRLQQKQAQFISQLPEEGFTEEDWHEITKEFFLTRLNYGRMIEAAVQHGDFDRVERLRDELQAKLEDIHRRAEQGISRDELAAYLQVTARVRTPEELEFEDAQSLFDLWMSLVGDGSLLSGREKTAISNFFRSHPLIQKYFPSSSLDLTNLTTEQKLLLMRRRQIWRQFYALSDTPATQVDYINMVRDELNMINQSLGFPPVTVLDYRLPVPELPSHDPLFERAQMRLALLRRQVLEEQRPDLSPEELDQLERQLAADPQDPSFLTSKDVDLYIRQYAVPDGFYATP